MDFSYFNSLQKIAYYLYLIGCYQKNLPVAILKLLIQPLVLSHLHYTVSVCGPSLSHDLQPRLERMINHAVRIVYGLRNVSPLWRSLGWFFVQSLIQCHCLLMLYHHYHSDTENTILLSPPIQFGRQSHCDTRTALHFAVPCRLRLSFTQNFFCSKGAYRWSNLPSFLSLCSK